MSKVYADKIEPRDSSMDVTIGTSTNTVTLAGNDLRANTVKDSGGNTLWTSDGSGNLSSVNSALAGNLKLLTTQTASSATSVDFTVDSTYDVYCFRWININPGTSDANLGFNGSTDSGSNYNTTKTTTFFRAQHGEGGAAADLLYVTSWDLAQSTARQPVTFGITNDSDGSGSGELYLFDPASTTYVKHFYCRTQEMNANSPRDAIDIFVAGYLNVTAAVNSVRFDISTGNFDGTIKMYGLL